MCAAISSAQGNPLMNKSKITGSLFEGARIKYERREQRLMRELVTFYGRARFDFTLP